ncbi:MAG: DoxX family membrane protein [Patescibacteria group bacterium]
MNKASIYILRIGLAITFLWIGILILKEPGVWSGYVNPWAIKFLPSSLEHVMTGTAVLDIIIGALLLFDFFTWPAALVGTFHLLLVLAVSGITDITVRDIGLLGGTIAMLFENQPEFLKKKFIGKESKTQVD